MAELSTRRAPGRWLTRKIRTAAGAARRRPPIITLALIVCIVSTYLRLQVGLHLPTLRFITDAFSPRALIEGRYGVIATSSLLTRDPFMVISICLSLLATMGIYEVIAGHVRSACLAVFAVIVAPLSVTLGLLLLDVLGSGWAQTRLETLDIGASAIVAASSGAIAGIARHRPLTLGLAMFLLGGLAVHHQLADWEHVLIFPWGYLAGRVLGVARIPPRRASAHPMVAYALACASLVAVGLPASVHLLPGPKAYHTASGRPLSPPRIVDTRYPTPSLRGSRHVLVLLPAGYENSSTTRYPVVELLHGDPGTPPVLVSLAKLAAAQATPGVRPFIGLVPDGHEPKGSWFANLPGDSMGTAMTNDLRTWAARRFRVNTSWSYAGLSSGGFGAVYLPLISSFPVHASCALSGYFDGNIPVLARADAAAHTKASALANASREPNLTFIAYGVRDSRSARASLKYAAALRRAHKRVVLKTYTGGHDWTVWKAAFRDCFRTILADKTSTSAGPSSRTPARRNGHLGP